MAPADIVVTGAGGLLGRLVVRALRDRGAAVLGLGRRVAPPDSAEDWATVDLHDVAALRAALPRGAVVVHAASDPRAPGADARTAGLLAGTAAEAGIARIVYVQIAGMGPAALSASAYYRDKAAAEQTLRRGPVPCSIVAAAQFHALIDRVFKAASIGPLLLRSPFRLQPVDVAFVAERLADHVGALRAEDMTVCGPEALSSREMASAWIAARGRRTLPVPVPAVGRLAGFAHIRLVRGVSGGSTWTEWLSRDGAS